MTLAAGSSLGIGNFNVASATIALDVDSTPLLNEPIAKFSIDGSLAIPFLGSGSIAVSGWFNSLAGGQLNATADQFLLGGPGSQLRIIGDLNLKKVGSQFQFGSDTGVTAKWNAFGNLLSGGFDVSPFRIATPNSIDHTFTSVKLIDFGSLELTTGAVRLFANSQNARLELQSPSLKVPGFQFGGSNVFTFSSEPLILDTTATFEVERALDFSLGAFSIDNGELVLRRLSTGIYELVIRKASLYPDVTFALPGLAEVVLPTQSGKDYALRVDTAGNLNVTASAGQLGPSFLHIQNAILDIDKTATSLSVTLDGGQLDLPVGPNIALPELAFNSSTGNLTPKSLSLTPAHLDFGPYFQRPPWENNRTFQLSVTDGALTLVRPDGYSAFPMLALPGSDLDLHSLLISADLSYPYSTTFEIGLHGTLGFGDFRMVNAEFLATKYANLVRIEPTAPVNVDLGLMTVQMDGYAQSDGQFSFVSAAQAFGFGNVTFTVSNSGFSGTVRNSSGTLIGSVNQAGCVSLAGLPSAPLPGASSHACEPAFSINDVTRVEGTGDELPVFRLHRLDVAIANKQRERYSSAHLP